ncbi:hypothetical protein MKEN_00780700 [Mycena kentingensis (nom. inval.)]|nr:hypothetical protein MKEN_00780700 [Mycena kentingensis (nom. inval.)]
MCFTKLIDSSILPEEMANQSVRLKEEQLRREEEKLREIELRVQREINEKRQELLAKEESLRAAWLHKARRTSSDCDTGTVVHDTQWILFGSGAASAIGVTGSEDPNKAAVQRRRLSTPTTMASLFTFVSLSLAVVGVASKPLSTSPFLKPASQRTPIGVASLFEDNRYGAINNSAHETHPLTDDAFAVAHVYEHLGGYAGRFSAQVVDQLRALPEVDFVERDQIVRTQDEVFEVQETQKMAPWGLARISHRRKLGLSTLNKYEHNPQGGEGVDVYVVDTGININHVEFEGRASWGKTIPQNDVDEDGNGHGTHCAGTIASRKYGVAKSAHVIAVKVLGSNGSGSMSDVVNGVEFALSSAIKKKAAADAELKATGYTAHKGSVASMSLGGGKSEALDRAVNAAVDKGLHFAVAAGNDNRDACNYSPAAAEKAVTVGASTVGDARAYFSNFGKCVDIFGPGLNIQSTWIGSNTASNKISGTSMATPHVAGQLAYFLSLYPSKEFNPQFKSESVAEASVFQRPIAIALSSTMYVYGYAALPSWVANLLPFPAVEEAVAPIPTLTPAQLKRALLQLATPNALSDVGAESPNLLLFNNQTIA